MIELLMAFVAYGAWFGFGFAVAVAVSHGRVQREEDRAENWFELYKQALRERNRARWRGRQIEIASFATPDELLGSRTVEEE